ncbi:MAG TPA: T9SS type A sorting domain-containing protein [Flavitalea sp.]|nr:T9SS type A sorting domain-containing protein [Flavitalea sp.]
MKVLHPQLISRAAKKILPVLGLILCLHETAKCQGGSKELVFKDGVLVSGVAGNDGAIYRFSQVDSKLDALVKVTGRSDNKVKLVSIDVTSAGWDKAFQPQVTYGTNNTTPNGISDWYMEFEITFVGRGTNTVSEIGKFDCSAIDIDGNGHLISENATFFGIESYILEANSLLNITNVVDPATGQVIGKKFQGPVLNFVSIDTSGTPVMTTLNYKNKSKIIIRAGAHANGASTASDRLYAFWFRSFSYNSAEVNILPLKMNSFNAKLKANKVELNWEVSEQNNISHYVVERSLDGNDYVEAGIVFANEEGLNKYNYTDVINIKKKGMLYYRLKAVSNIGNHMFSSTRLIRLEEEVSLTIKTYPNPFTKELRVSVPQTWQDRKISFELYNMNGQLVKQLNSNKASQTEVINVDELGNGLYTMKVTSVAGVVSQQIIKAR